MDCAQVIARKLPGAELAGLKEMFAAIDEDGSGTISVDELREGLRKKGTKIDQAEVQRIMDNIDVNGNRWESAGVHPCCLCMLPRMGC